MNKQEKIDTIKVLKKLRSKVKSSKFGLYNRQGICHIIWFDSDFADEHTNRVYKMIKKLPTYKESDYCWKPRVKAPRIKWLTEQIKKLENKGINK